MKVAIPFDVDLNIIKSYEDEEGLWIIEGYAATTDIDLQGDKILKEALKNSEKDLEHNSTVLRNHNLDEEIGKVLKSKVKDNGLWIKVLISKTVPAIWKKITEGVLNKFSIKGKVLDAAEEYIEEAKKVIQVIKEMYLTEVSLVSVPANPKAKSIRWYIEKAITDWKEEGGTLMAGKISEVRKQIKQKNEEDEEQKKKDLKKQEEDEKDEKDKKKEDEEKEDEKDDDKAGDDDAKKEDDEKAGDEEEEDDDSDDEEDDSDDSDEEDSDDSEEDDSSDDDSSDDEESDDDKDEKDDVEKGLSTLSKSLMSVGKLMGMVKDKEARKELQNLTNLLVGLEDGDDDEKDKKSVKKSSKSKKDKKIKKSEAGDEKEELDMEKLADMVSEKMCKKLQIVPDRKGRIRKSEINKSEDAEDEEDDSDEEMSWEDAQEFVESDEFKKMDESKQKAFKKKMMDSYITGHRGE